MTFTLSIALINLHHLLLYYVQIQAIKEHVCVQMTKIKLCKNISLDALCQQLSAISHQMTLE